MNPKRVRLIGFNELPQLIELYKHLNTDDPEIEMNEELREHWKQIFNTPSYFYL